MCLTISKEATEQFWKKNKDKKTVTVWKVIQPSTKAKYESLYMGTPIKTQEFMASRPLVAYKPNLKRKQNTLENGCIHVWKSREIALNDCMDGEVLVRCTAKVKDFIAAGDQDLAFRKIRFPKWVVS